MIVYIKEYPGKLTQSTVRVWIKDFIPVSLYNGECTSYQDYVIISKYDNHKNITGDATILIYEDFFESFSQNILEEINYNYDYYYLYNALEEAKNNTAIDTIITGSSYGLFGIDQSLPSSVNLSLMSQDLYYSVMGIKDVCEYNHNIKNIVLCCSYYYLYSDLSMTQNPTEISRISKVYYPLFHDLHNTLHLPPKINFLPESKLIDIHKVIQLFSREEYVNHYFNNERPKTRFATKVWDDISKTWQQLSEENRKQAGIIRADLHNSGIKYVNSFKENERILENLSQYCDEKKINLVILSTPISSYYREASLPQYKEDFYRVLNNIQGTIHLIDLYDDLSFTIDDYNDTDHLSDLGAAKLTSILQEVLNKL